MLDMQLYKTRNPVESDYYKCIENHFEELEGVWDEKFKTTYGYWRNHITDVIYKYLDCGNLKYGFARIKCKTCNAEYLLPFSCKCRYFCPSCHQRRVIEFGEYLYEEILKDVPHRQWVFSIPKRIRPFFMYNRKLLSKLSKCAWKVLSNYLKESVSVKDTIPGVVVSIQTFGDFINFNPHIHIVATDGCFDGDGEFVIGNIPNASEVEEVFQIEVLNMLKKEELITDFIIQNMFSWKHSGFNIYCGNVIESENQDGIEKLGRYIIRAPISQERMKYISSNKSHDGIAKVIYKSKTTGKSKTFDVLEWCAKVVSHIPNKGEQLVRYYGFYSNKSRGQRKKANTDNKIPSLVNTDISKKHFKKNWARLIQKIYNVDPLECKKCGGQMRIISFIEEEAVIKKILLHLGLWYKDLKKNHDPPKNIAIKNIPDSQKSYDNCDSQVTKYEDEFSQVNPYDEF